MFNSLNFGKNLNFLIMNIIVIILQIEFIMDNNHLKIFKYFFNDFLQLFLIIFITIIISKNFIVYFLNFGPLLLKINQLKIFSINLLNKNQLKLSLTIIEEILSHPSPSTVVSAIQVSNISFNFP